MAISFKGTAAAFLCASLLLGSSGCTSLAGQTTVVESKRQGELLKKVDSVFIGMPESYALSVKCFKEFRSQLLNGLTANGVKPLIARVDVFDPKAPQFKQLAAQADAPYLLLFTAESKQKSYGSKLTTTLIDKASYGIVWSATIDFAGEIGDPEIVGAGLAEKVIATMKKDGVL